MSGTNQENANVVLEADVSGYNKQIDVADTKTKGFIKTIDDLSTKMTAIGKRTGKTISIISAADLAAMTGFAVVAAGFDKKLKGIEVTLTKSGESIGKYKKNINDLSRTFPIARDQVTELETSISHLGVTSQREVASMSQTFIKLSAATSSSLTGISTQMIELSRSMGTLGDGYGAQAMSKFSDSLTTVSHDAGVSAEGVLSFSNSISPIAKVAGLSQTAVMGVSAAFVKSGADGFAAANTFNSMLSDIARSVRNGSPELAKYSSLVGKSMADFKNMDPQERIVEIFEAINKAGPDAVNVVDRLGYDGIRAAKSIQAVAAQSGGLRKAVEEAKSSYGDGTTQEASDIAFDNMNDSIIRIKNSFEQWGSAIGTGALIPLSEMAKVMANMADTFTPIVTMFGQIAGFAATIAGLGGSILGPVVSSLSGFGTLAMGAWAARKIAASSGVQGFRDNRDPSKMSDKGKKFAAGEMGRVERAGYVGGQAIGKRMGMGATPTGPIGRFATSIAMAPFKAMTYATNYGNEFYRESAGWGKGKYAENGRLVSSMKGSITGKSHEAGKESIREALRKNEAANEMRKAAGEQTRSLSGGDKLSAYNTGFKTHWDTNTGAKLATASEAAAKNYTAQRSAYADTKHETYKAMNNGSSEGFSRDNHKAAFDSNNQQLRTKLINAELAKVSGGLRVTDSSVRKFSGAVSQATLALLRMKGTAVGAGLSNARQVASKAMGALGMSPGMLAGMAVMGVGMAAYSSRKEHNEKADALFASNRPTTANLDEALGSATAAVTTFAQATKAAASAIGENAAPEDVFKTSVDEKEKIASQSAKYNDEKVGKLQAGVNSGAAYLKSLGPLDSKHALAARSDIIKRYGDDAKQIFDNYQSPDTDNNITGAYGSGNGAVIGLIDEAFTKQRNAADTINPYRFFENTLGTNDDTDENIQQAIIASQQQMTLNANAANDEVSKQASVVGLLDIATGAGASARARFGDEAGNNNSYADPMLTRIGKGLEAAVPALGDTGTGADYVKTMTRNQGDVNAGIQEFLASNKDNAKIDDLKALFTDKDGNITVGNDYREKLQAAIIDPKNWSDTEKKIRGTALGNMMRTDEQINSTTGAAGSNIGVPKEMTKSVTRMADALEKGIKFTDPNTGVSKDIGAGSYQDKVDAIQETKNSIETKSSDQFYVQEALLAEVNSRQTDKQKVQGKFENWNEKGIAATKVLNNPLSSDEDIKSAMATQHEIKDQYTDFLQSIRHQQVQFDISMERQAEDYNQSVAYAEEDFQRQRAYANKDFLEQRQRMQEDYDLSMKRQIEDSAKTLYDPYSRVQVEQQLNASTAIANMDEQTAMMKKQVTNLSRLKELGVSQASIDMFSLADTNHAQQADRFVTELEQDPSKVGELEKSTKGKLSATKGLVQNESNTSYTRQEADRKKSLSHQDKDFAKSMDHAADAFEQSMERGDAANKKSVRRAQEDMAQMYKDLNENRKKMQKEAIKWLEEKMPGLTDVLVKHMEGVKDHIGFVFKVIAAPELAPPPAAASEKPKLTYKAPLSTNQNTHKNILDLGKDAKKGFDYFKDKVLGKDKTYEGGVTMTPQTRSLSETGPELILPLNSRGEAFVANTMKRATASMLNSVASNSYKTHGGGGNSTQINSTQSYYTVEKVIAQDPNEMARRLKEKERLNSMRQPKK